MHLMAFEIVIVRCKFELNIVSWREVKEFCLHALPHVHKLKCECVSFKSDYNIRLVTFEYSDEFMVWTQCQFSVELYFWFHVHDVQFCHLL